MQRGDGRPRRGEPLGAPTAPTHHLPTGARTGTDVPAAVTNQRPEPAKRPTRADLFVARPSAKRVTTWGRSPSTARPQPVPGAEVRVDRTTSEVTADLVVVLCRAHCGRGRAGRTPQQAGPGEQRVDHPPGIESARRQQARRTRHERLVATGRAPAPAARNAAASARAGARPSRLGAPSPSTVSAVSDRAWLWASVRRTGLPPRAGWIGVSRRSGFHRAGGERRGLWSKSSPTPVQ